MKIERTGKVDRLTPRMKRFIIEALAGISLDDIQDADQRRIDYSCLHGLLAVELKSLDEDADERLSNLTNELRQRPDWPVFYGKWSIEAVLQHLEQPDPVRRRILERIGRAVENHIHKANKQLAAHEKAFPRKNMVRIVTLVNEDHAIYDPDTVAYVIDRLLRRVEGGHPLYGHIDTVIYLSERHATVVNGRVAFPILGIEGFPIRKTPWKREIVSLVLQRWGQWNRASVFDHDPATHRFSTIDDVPNAAPRHEVWTREYQRSPYMQVLTKEQLRERFDEVICISALAMIRDSPFKPPSETVNSGLKTMSHIMAEMARRALPMSYFKYESMRLAAAARRLGLLAPVVVWFERDLGRTK